jgi:hypothetical protein
LKPRAQTTWRPAARGGEVVHRVEQRGDVVRRRPQRPGAQPLLTRREVRLGAGDLAARRWRLAEVRRPDDLEPVR